MLQYFLHKIIDSTGLLAQCFVYFGILFLDSSLERAFCHSGFFSVPLLAHFWCQRLLSEWFWRDRKHNMKNRAWRDFEHFRQSGGAVPYNNLWSVAVLGHAKGQGESVC